jgi:hypothetical protein
MIYGSPLVNRIGLGSTAVSTVIIHQTLSIIK